MASPFGGIDPDLLKQIQALLQGIGPSAEDKAAAKQHALLTAGLGMMQNANLNPIRAVGMGGLLGQGAYNDELKFIAQNRAQNLQGAASIMPLAMQMQFMKRMGNANLYGQQPGAPTAPSYSAGGMPTEGMDPNAARATAGMGGGTAGAFGAPPPVTGAPNPPTPSTGDPLIDEALALGIPRSQLATMTSVADLNKAINEFAKPDSYRPGGYRAVGGKIQQLPVAPPNTQLVPQPDGTWATVPVGGALAASAQNEATNKAVGLSLTPQIGIIPGTSKTGIVGNALDAVLQGGQPPYGALAPYGPTTQAAINSGKVVQGPNGKLAPAPKAPVQTALSPEETAHSSDLAEYEKSVKSTAQAASKQDATLTQMDNLMKYFKPDPTLPFRADMAGYAQGIPGIGRPIADALVSHSATALPAIQAFQKLGVQMTGAQLKDGFGTREAAQIIGMVSRAIPNAGQVPGAPETILKFMHGINQWGHDQEQALAAWKADPAHNNSSEGFETFWNKEHPVSSYVPPLTVLDDIAAGKPAGTTPAAGPSETIKTTAEGIPYIDKGTSAPAAGPKMTRAGSANSTATMIFRDALKNGDTKTIERLRAKGYVE